MVKHTQTICLMNKTENCIFVECEHKSYISSKKKKYIDLPPILVTIITAPIYGRAPHMVNKNLFLQ